MVRIPQSRTIIVVKILSQSIFKIKKNFKILKIMKTYLMTILNLKLILYNLFLKIMKIEKFNNLLKAGDSHLINLTKKESQQMIFVLFHKILL